MLDQISADAILVELGFDLARLDWHTDTMGPPAHPVNRNCSPLTHAAFMPTTSIMNRGLERSQPRIEIRFYPGAALAAARVRQGLLQADVAQAVGIPHQYMSEIERGHKPLTETHLKALPAPIHAEVRAALVAALRDRVNEMTAPI